MFSLGREEHNLRADENDNFFDKIYNKSNKNSNSNNKIDKAT